MSTIDDRVARTDAVAARLIDVYMHRAGAEDSGLILEEFAESSDDAVRALAELALTLAFYAADALTLYDITDPVRRLDLSKIARLERMAADAGQMVLNGKGA